MTKYTKTFADAMKEVRKPKVVKEDYEVSMAIGQLKTIQDRVGKIMDFLSLILVQLAAPEKTRSRFQSS